MKDSTIACTATFSIPVFSDISATKSAFVIINYEYSINWVANINLFIEYLPNDKKQLKIISKTKS